MERDDSRHPTLSSALKIKLYIKKKEKKKASYPSSSSPPSPYPLSESVTGSNSNLKKLCIKHKFRVFKHSFSVNGLAFTTSQHTSRYKISQSHWLNMICHALTLQIQTRLIFPGRRRQYGGHWFEMLFLPFPSGSLFRLDAISFLWCKLQNRRTAGGE